MFILKYLYQFLWMEDNIKYIPPPKKKTLSIMQSS